MNKRTLKKIVTVMSIIVLCISIGVVSYILHENSLDNIQKEALAVLERDSGRYDEESIVLIGTSKAKAEKLANKLGADLRITNDGEFAKLTLKDGVTIKDVYGDRSNRKYISEMCADYYAELSDVESEVLDYQKTPILPDYYITDQKYDSQSYLGYLNIKDSWYYSTGEGVTVAVIDTGIDTDHPDFEGRISEFSYNVTKEKIVKDHVLEDGSYDWSLIEDHDGHGTAVTGVLAASINDSGIVGVAPSVNIIVIKSEKGAVSDYVFGMYYAVERDVQVINMSIGASVDVFESAVQLAYDSDVICVASAGNKGSAAPLYPAACDKVIGVGALAEDSWELADYSNYGENSDLVAPGTVYTTYPGGSYCVMEGTSFSAPIVAGAISMFMQDHKYTTFEEVTENLFASSLDLGDLGNDWYYGFGALDIGSLITAKRGTVSFDMLTDEVDDQEALFIQGRPLQELPEPDRLYAIFDGWYYDDTFTQAVDYYRDGFRDDLTLYAKWVNEDDGVPYTYVVLEDGTVEIRSYTGHRKYITVPNKIDGRVVSSIGDYAFAEEREIREIKLPTGLTNIGNKAFESCTNLRIIEIPEGVTAIKTDAFFECIRLHTIAFVGDSALETVGKGAFSSCSSLERIELPAKLRNIDATAFFGDISLERIDVVKENTYFEAIDGVLFNEECTNLIVYPIAHGTIYDVPDGVDSIGPYAFNSAEIHEVNIDGVAYIGEGAFSGSALKEIDIPDSVVFAGKDAFRNCEALERASIGSGLSYISEGVFRCCYSLKEITVPAQISLIYNYAFQEAGLKEIEFEEGSKLAYIGISAFNISSIEAVKLPTSVDTIDSGAFASTPLSSIEFTSDSKLRIIGEDAFKGCSSLCSIELPKQLEAIYDSAFFESGLEKALIPASVSVLGDGVFGCCEALTEIEVETGNEYYHSIDGVVYTLDDLCIVQYPGAKSDKIYYINTATRTMRPASFAGTVCLEEVYVPEGFVEIPPGGFKFSGIYAVHLPSTLKRIGASGFLGTSNLSKISLPEGFEEIGSAGFRLSGIYSAELPSTLTTIGGIKSDRSHVVL